MRNCIMGAGVTYEGILYPPIKYGRGLKYWQYKGKWPTWTFQDYVHQSWFCWEWLVASSFHTKPENIVYFGESFQDYSWIQDLEADFP